MNYEKVPNIITGKDLDYLSDMFNWNCGAYKNIYNAIEQVKDNEIKEMLTKASNMFYNNLNVVLNILSSGVNNE